MLLLVAKLAGRERAASRCRIFATSSDGTELKIPGSWHPAHGLPWADDDGFTACFERAGDLWYLRPGLRDGLVIGAHDLLSSPPLGNLDLVVCRDALADLDQRS